DTLRLRVEAWDNFPAPATHVGRSRELALRLPSLEELRAATRTASQDVAAAADSLAGAQGDLGARTRDLAQERSRDASGTRRPAEWNREDAPRPDSTGAARQRALGDRTDSLARGIEQVAADLKAAGHEGAEGEKAAPLAAPQQAAQDARAAMRRAAQSADLGKAPAAAQAGADAEQQLSDVADALHERGDSLASEWRNETLAALDRALAETAELATGQQRVAEALRHGETGPATRSQQASVEEGTDAVARQISEAAGKHALVSPQL